MNQPTITGFSFIGNERGSSTHQPFRTYYSAGREENPWLFYAASKEETARALELASTAFEAYKNVTHAQRAEFLRSIANEIIGLDELLLEVYMRESSLPLARARAERSRTVHQLTSMARWIEEGRHLGIIIETAQPSPEGINRVDLRKMHIPLGTVAVFGASNFPLAYSTAGGDTASALAAGCPVIVKGHPMHAGTGELVAGAVIRAARATGMPNGVFSNLHAFDYQIGQQLVEHPAVAAVGFTGSHAGGRALFDLASKRKNPIPVFAEMGSTNPVIILPSSIENDVERSQWVVKITASMTNGAGQFCTQPGLLFMLRSAASDAFRQDMTQHVLESQKQAMLHPGIYDRFKKGKESVMAAQGVRRAADGGQQDMYAGGVLLELDARDFVSNPHLHQEVFGPLSLAVLCESMEEMRSALATLEGQLTGTLIGEPTELKESGLVEVLREKVGRLIFNGVPTGVEVNAAMQHGGPYPATTDARFTAVGPKSIDRWMRPITFQNTPEELLPEELQLKTTAYPRILNGNLLAGDEAGH
ncbi:MAG: hypothetical protein RL226_398 [Bacteroidota bacterium]